MGYIKEQIKVIKERDPAIKKGIEVFLYPSFYALLFHRWGHWFYKKNHFFIARLISQLSRGLTGIEIHPGATIGKGLFIDHGMGVVIGETCEIGDNVTIYHGVTLGGTGKDHGKRHPTIGNNVMISTGAKVLGPFKVGDNARIAANAVVLQEIPADSTVVGIPGKVVRISGRRLSPNDELDQVKVPDPVKLEIRNIKEQIAFLEEQLKMIDDKLGLSVPENSHILDECPELYVLEKYDELRHRIEFIREARCCDPEKCELNQCETKREQEEKKN